MADDGDALCGALLHDRIEDRVREERVDLDEVVAELLGVPHGVASLRDGGDAGCAPVRPVHPSSLEDRGAEQLARVVATPLERHERFGTPPEVQDGEYAVRREQRELGGIRRVRVHVRERGHEELCATAVDTRGAVWDAHGLRGTDGGDLSVRHQHGMIAQDGVSRHRYDVEPHERGDGRLRRETVGLLNDQESGKRGDATNGAPHALSGGGCEWDSARASLVETGSLWSFRAEAEGRRRGIAIVPAGAYCSIAVAPCALASDTRATW